MAQIIRVDKAVPMDPRRIPEALSATVSVLDALRQSGLLSEVGRRFHPRRQGGYCGLDVVLFLLAYHSSGQCSGIKAFYQSFSPWWAQVAAVADRRSLPTPGSMSRALGGMEMGPVRDFARWLLVEALDLRPLFEHPATHHGDARGDAWHVFDYDPTREVLRQRRLPKGGELPDGERLADRLRAAPGHSGRKRGEVQITRSVLEHAGSGLWLDMQLEPGNGDARAQLEAALAAAVRVCARVGHPKDRAMVRMDGQFGGVPSIAAARASGLHFVTRSAHHGLLERDEVRRSLSAATWTMVPDSGTGPARGAADAGWLLLEPSPGTRRADGSPYAPERVRVVATRYPAPRSGKAFRGVVHEGVCYEFLATDLVEEAWPAEAVAALYFQRATQENRFAQEDREFELDRLLAYHLPGQELAAVIGAFIWNWQTLTGFAASPAPVEDVPPPSAAQRHLDERPLVRPQPVHPETPAPVPVAAPPPALGAPLDPRARRAHLDASRAVIAQSLPALFSGSYLQKAGWTLDRSRAALLCPNGEPYLWQGVTRRGGNAAARVAFNTTEGACRACTADATCRKEGRKLNYQPTLTLPPALAARALTPTSLRPAGAVRTSPPALLPASERRGPLAPRPPAFRPAVARCRGRSLAAQQRYFVEVAELPAPRRLHPDIAPDARRRGHRRATHEVNLARYGLPASLTVRLHAAGPPIPLDHVRRFERHGAFLA